jgi:endo-1,4-beta-xylanase
MNEHRFKIISFLASWIFVTTIVTAQTVLKDVYKDAFLIGTAVNPGITSGRDKATQDIVIKQFNSITVENVMKAALINPEPGVYNFGPADEFVAFGEKNKMFIIGHTLVWHNQCPPWFFTNASGKPNTKEEQIERLRSHIEVVAGRYAGRVHAWDVVNEVIGEDGNYRPTTWVNAFGNGDTLVKYAFMFAAKYAPNTELYYNDFNEWRPAKKRWYCQVGERCCRKKVFASMVLVCSAIGD